MATYRDVCDTLDELVDFLNADPKLHELLEGALPVQGEGASDSFFQVITSKKLPDGVQIPPTFKGIPIKVEDEVELFPQT